MGDFPNVFRTLRQGMNLTQDELAKALNISKSSISMYENGNREPDFETLEKIADYFHVDMNYLVGRTSQAVSSAVELRQHETSYEDVELLVARNGKKMTTEQRMRLIKLLSEID